MATSGKYDFDGIKKVGAKSLLLALSSNPYFIWVERLKLTLVLEIALEWIINWAANNGLVLLNLGAVFVEGHFDQKAFDAALQDGLSEVEIKKGKLTPAQVKAIDDKVIIAARKFFIFTR